MISVFGLGFVGLTTALGFCNNTNEKVIGYDIDIQRKTSIYNLNIPFWEPGLDELLKKHLNHSFFVADNMQDAAENTNIAFLCVGTPCQEDGNANLEILKAAVSEILVSYNKDIPLTLVIKSTVPPGTMRDIIAPLCEKMNYIPGKGINLCSNPEFLREGHAADDFINPDRIVIGEYNEGCGEALAALYSNFNAPIIRVNNTTAEFIKYSSNTLLSCLISYSNELSMIADYIGDIDVTTTFKTLHMDKRWKNNSMSTYAYPGCGFGGYCLPKDTQALISRATQAGYNPVILREVLNVNETIKKHTADKIITSASLTGNCVGILGLSFKAGSDDIRNTPTVDILKYILDAGIKVYAYDPMSNESFNTMYKFDITYCDSSLELMKTCQTIAILTAWPEFKALDFASKNVIDGRYIL